MGGVGRFSLEKPRRGGFPGRVGGVVRGRMGVCGDIRGGGGGR